jgi:hypothetical protein
MPSGQGVAWWSIGKLGAGQIGKMLLLPFITGCIGFWRLGQRAMQLAMPLRLNPGRLDLAGIDYSAALAPSPRKGSAAIIAVAIAVAADVATAQPSE